ncbi:MAG: ABC transporter substrate-binding protein [Alteromonadaceae bacterium]|nr:ABC transporter substrate-binding protein [Alteromonadaceae bacterium]
MLSLLYSSIAAAVDSSNNTAIVLGMSNALTGPASGLGLELKKGSLLYFNEINQQGGITGRKIKLISYDDGYEPERAYKNTQQLIYNDKVFALFGYVGTPTSLAVLPIVNKEKSLYFAPFTGADFLRTPVISTVFNIRGSYYAEVETQINYFVNHKKYSQIGLFIQADAFGLAVTRGIDKYLKQKKIKSLVSTRFKRNTSNVDKAVKALLGAYPQVVFCVGTYQPIAELINQMRAKGYQGDFVSVSFVGAHALAQRLNSLHGVYVSNVVPSPKNSTVAIVKEYQSAMKKAGFSEFNHESLEGYINAKTFVAIAKRCTKLTKACFIEQAEQFDETLSGLHIHFDPQDHQGMKNIYLQNLATGLSVFPKETK